MTAEEVEHDDVAHGNTAKFTERRTLTHIQIMFAKDGDPTFWLLGFPARWGQRNFAYRLRGSSGTPQFPTTVRAFGYEVGSELADQFEVSPACTLAIGDASKTSAYDRRNLAHNRASRWLATR
jgi:hypothetical protein